MDSLTTDETTPAQKPSFFENQKKAKGAFITVLIFLIVFFLTAGALGYLYWQKNRSFKKLNQENQQRIDQLNKDRVDLDKQVVDLKKENEDLKNSNKESIEAAANKKTITEAYTEILAYFAEVVETHGGFTGWTDAEYQHAREIAKKTQNSGFLSTVDWAWNQTGVDPTTRVVRFLKEISSGINENLD